MRAIRNKVLQLGVACAGTAAVLLVGGVQTSSAATSAPTASGAGVAKAGPTTFGSGATTASKPGGSAKVKPAPTTAPKPGATTSAPSQPQATASKVAVPSSTKPGATTAAHTPAGTASPTTEPTTEPPTAPATATAPANGDPGPTTGPAPGPDIARPAVPAGLPEGIEDLSTYVQQSSCDPVDKPGATDLAHLLTGTYPGTSAGISRTCGADGIASEHYEGRAVDWMVSVRDPHGAAEAQAVLGWLFAPDAAGRPYANARRLGIMYIIWNDHIWGAYATSSGWRPYSACAVRPEPAYDTTCHRNHIHFSLSWAGAEAHTSFWTKRVAAPDYGPCRASDLNWAAPYAAANPTPCPDFPAVTPPTGASAVAAALVHWSGIVMTDGSSGPYVAALQTALGVTADGALGPVTLAAVQTFRTAHGLASGNAVDAATWRVLLSASSITKPGRTAPRPGSGVLKPYKGTTLQFGSTGNAVTALQKALGVSPASGWFGPLTKAAVTAFQRSKHLKPTGVVDKKTWKALGA